MKKMFLIQILLITTFLINSKIPVIDQKDIIFVKANLGYDLYIKKLKGINSILLTESQKDPTLKKTNYALRTPTFQECNGNEKRFLDGKILQTKYDAFYLVDSTTEKHPKLGESFHFFLPEKVLFGYSWARTGELIIKPGVEINLRVFEKEFADYTGAFADQWIILNLSPTEDKFNPGAIDSLSEISKESNGIIKIKSDQDNLEDLFKKFIIDNVPTAPDADIIFIIDTTYSMKEEMPVFKKDYSAIKEALLKKIPGLRIGLIVYRDYGDLYLNRSYDLTSNLKEIDYLISKIEIDDGGDVPEAIYEAIYELKKMTFKSDNRIIFLIADAPAHPLPRGKISKLDALNLLKEFKIKVDSICLPVR